MNDNTLSNFILNGCYGEVKRYNKYIELLPYELEEYERGQWTYVVELMIITVKSLIPSIDKLGITVDYHRFNEELKLWTHYRHGKNDALIKAVCSINDESYWTNFDDSIYSRLVPIVAANDNWDVITNEVIKNVLFTTGNIQILLESILLSKLLFLVLERNNRTFEEIINHLKEDIIGLSQKHFILEYQDYFRVPLEKYNGNYSIDFERNRIDIINLLNGVYKKEKCEVLLNCLETMNRNIEMNKNESFFHYGLKGLINNNVANNEIKDRDFILSLCNYLVKLRKGRISPERLTINNYNIIDIFMYKEGDVFIHSLLNKCEVINRKELNNMIIIHIKSKSGIYRFFKRKNNINV